MRISLGLQQPLVYGDGHLLVDPNFFRAPTSTFLLANSPMKSEIHFLAGENQHFCENQHFFLTSFLILRFSYFSWWDDVEFLWIPMFCCSFCPFFCPIFQQWNRWISRLNFKKRKTSARPNSSAWRRGSVFSETHHDLMYVMWLNMMSYMAMDQYLLIPFSGGWTSIYQLFWCSPGVQGFDTLPYHVYYYVMVV